MPTPYGWNARNRVWLVGAMPDIFSCSAFVPAGTVT